MQKSCSRCNKNTWHVESGYIFQPPKYLLFFVNRFRYINNNVTKDRCSIPMDTTVRHGPLKFSLRVIIDHHGPSIHSGHYIAYIINCCKKTFYCNDHTITEFGIIDSKKLLYCICYTIWIDWHMSFGLEQEGGSLIVPMALAHPLHPNDNRSRNRRFICPTSRTDFYYRVWPNRIIYESISSDLYMIHIHLTRRLVWIGISITYIRRRH